MTKEEVTAVQQRMREAWAKYQQAALKAPRRFQHFTTEAERQQHQREVEQAQRNGSSF